MRISLINEHMIERDAMGQSVLNQARFFVRRGDDLRISVMYLPHAAPEDLAHLSRVVDVATLADGRDEHFASSDLYVFHFGAFYPVVELLKTINRGVVIFHYHNVTPPELWGSRHGLELSWRSVIAVRELTPFADLIVTPSPFNADQLVSQYACERGRIRVLPLGVAVDRFRPGARDAALVSQYRLEGRRVILFVGRMAGNKRIDLLVEALPLVRRHVPNATLMLVGNDRSHPAFVEHAARARGRAQELGVDTSVIFTGPVDDLAHYYRLADVYATASLHEGFDVPIIEAMASGVPVVASRATAHPWVVGDAGLLAEPGDAAALAAQIVRVLSEEELRKDLARRGLARAQELSLERYEAGWAAVVAEAEALLPKQPRRRFAPERAAGGRLNVPERRDG